MLFFANALGACLGILANKFILPLIGYEGVFIFYGTLTITSGMLLALFHQRVGHKKPNAHYVPIY